MSRRCALSLVLPVALGLQLPGRPLTSPGTTPAAAVTPAGDYLDRLLQQSRSIKCPFFRRRAGDLIESGLWVLDFVASRHKSLDVMPPKPMGLKVCGSSVSEVMEVVRRDIEGGQYYVSGRLTPSVYSDACFFDGPDPDMPVRSLQRYTDALRGLFDPRSSTIELLGMEQRGPRQFTAHWRLEGALRLPGSPRIKPYVGCTLYELDDDGLIASHTESWSITALDAFVSTVWPDFGAAAAPAAAELSPEMRVAPPPARLRHGREGGHEQSAQSRGSLLGSADVP